MGTKGEDEADAAVRFLRKKRFKEAYKLRRGSWWHVRISGFDSMKSPRAVSTQKKVKRLEFRGRTAFDEAYFLRNPKVK